MAEKSAHSGPVEEATVQGPSRWTRVLHWLRLAIGVLALGAVAMGVEWLLDPSVTPLRVARIEGDLHYLKRSELEQAVAASIRDGFFTVDVQEVKRAAEALPWVARVTVRRVWPDTLHLWVVEQVPLARWGGQALLNVQGEIFQPDAASFPAGLPLLNGPEQGAATVASRYRWARELLRTAGMELKRLELSERYAWQLETDKGITLYLGQEAFEPRLRRWLEIYPLLRDSRPQPMLRVDMRYDNGMAVLWGVEKKAADTAS